MSTRDHYYSLRRRFRVICPIDLDNPVIKRAFDLLVKDCILFNIPSRALIQPYSDQYQLRHPLTLKHCLRLKYGRAV